MSERLSSFLILLGGLLAIIALWALSVMAVRWDTRRRAITDLERRAWVAVAVALPLFGFALYLFMRVLRQYLTPQGGPGADPRLSQADARVQAYRASPVERLTRPEGQPQAAARSGPVMAYPSASGTSARGTPQTIPATNQPLRGSYALAAIEGPHLGQQFILGRLPALIGRGPNMAIPLDADLNVSRRHAEIYEWNGALRIRDLHSAHGTQVNGTRVSDQPIFPGDRVRLGGTVLVLRDTENQTG